VHALGAQRNAASSELDVGSFVAPPDVHRLEVGGRCLLFSGGRQQLFELNPSADLIWRSLAAGQPPGEVEALLVEYGLPAEQAREFVALGSRQWMQAGHLIPTAVLEDLAAAPTASRTFRLDEMALELAFHGAASPDAADEVFGHLRAPAPAPLERLSVVAHDDLFFLFLDGAPKGAVAAHELTPQIKAILTDRYAQAVRGAFLAHGALLRRNGRSLFLSGQPGAGKTTLTLALSASGFAYGGDDIIRIDPDGQASAAPFAAAVKTGAWPLVERFNPAVASLPTCLRADGQQVRYLLPANRADRAPRPLDAVLLLDRRAGETARLEPVHAVEALHIILESAYSAEGALSPATLKALASTLESAETHRFVYSDLAEAVACIEGLIGG